MASKFVLGGALAGLGAGIGQLGQNRLDQNLAFKKIQKELEAKMEIVEKTIEMAEKHGLIPVGFKADTGPNLTQSERDEFKTSMMSMLFDNRPTEENGMQDPFGIGNVFEENNLTDRADIEAGDVGIFDSGMRDLLSKFTRDRDAYNAWKDSKLNPPESTGADATTLPEPVKTEGQGLIEKYGGGTPQGAAFGNIGGIIEKGLNTPLPSIPAMRKGVSDFFSNLGQSRQSNEPVEISEFGDVLPQASNVPESSGDPSQNPRVRKMVARISSIQDPAQRQKALNELARYVNTLGFDGTKFVEEKFGTK